MWWCRTELRETYVLFCMNFRKYYAAYLLLVVNHILIPSGARSWWAPGDLCVLSCRAAVPKPWWVLLEREKGCSSAGEHICRCSPLCCALTPAHPRGSSKALLAPEEEGVMGLGQVRSGTFQPSSSNATSFAGGSCGYWYRHSLQLKACSSRKEAWAFWAVSFSVCPAFSEGFKNLLFQ